MKNILHYTLLICFILNSNLAFSQQKKVTESGLSRYLFPQFTDGIVTMQNGRMAGAKLNYDTFSDQMQFMRADNVIMTIAEPEKVIKVSILDRNFFYIKNYFVELISNGSIPLYLRIHQQRIADKIGAYGSASPATSIQSVSTLSTTDGNITKLTANEEVSFTTNLIFYVTNNSKTKIIANQNDLLKCFSSKKELLKQELDRQNTKFNSIESVKKIIEWINANGIKD